MPSLFRKILYLISACTWSPACPDLYHSCASTMLLSLSIIKSAHDTACQVHPLFLIVIWIPSTFVYSLIHETHFLSLLHSGFFSPFFFVRFLVFFSRNPLWDATCLNRAVGLAGYIDWTPSHFGKCYSTMFTKKNTPSRSYPPSDFFTVCWVVLNVCPTYVHSSNTYTVSFPVITCRTSSSL